MAKVFPTLETECPTCASKLIIRYDKETGEYTTTSIAASETSDKGEPATPGEKAGEGAETGTEENAAEDDMDFGFTTS